MGIIQVLAVLRDRHTSHPQMFRPIISSVLVIASQPLLEARANERLRSESVHKIGLYYCELANFWLGADMLLATEVTKMFRCLINGGSDPTILRCDRKEWKGDNDGTRQAVLDKSYIMNIVRESRTIDVIVGKFNDSVTELKEAFLAFQRAGMKSRDDAPEPAAGAAPPAGNTAYERAREQYGVAKENCQVLLELCIELTADSKMCVEMCLLRVCDGAIRLFDLSAGENSRDLRIPECIDLMWTVLESYLAQPLDEGSSREQALRADVVDFEYTLAVFLRLLTSMLCDGYKLSDKECRNEIVMLLTMMASFPASTPCFVQSGMLNTLLTYACAAEADTDAFAFYSAPLAKLRNFASAFDIDIQFKRALWLLLGELHKYDDPDVILATAAFPLLDVLLAYCEFESLDLRESKNNVENKFGLQSPVREGSTVMQEPSVVQHTASIDSSADGGTFENAFSYESKSGGPVNASNISIVHGSMSLVEARDIAPERSAYIASLSMLQLRELQVMAMTFLAHNAARCMGEFLRINGTVRALDILFHYTSSPLAEHKELVYSCTLLLNRLVLCSPIVKEIMEYENAVQTLLNVLEKNSEERTRAQGVRLCAILCAGGNRVCQAQLRAGGGLKLLVRIVAAYANPRRPLAGLKAGIAIYANLGGSNDSRELNDPSEDPRGGDISVLIVAVVDCLVKAVVGNAASEGQFAMDEGVDATLDLLEASPYVLRTQMLRLLCDLIANPQLLVFVHAWRSQKTMRSAAQLLCHCWQDEEVRLGCVRENGVIANILDPLGDHSWPDDRRAPVMGDSVSSNNDTVRSIAVSRLANAIIASKQLTLGSVPTEVRSLALEKDTRIIVACTLQLMGLFESYTVPPDSIGSILEEEGEQKRDSAADARGFEEDGEPDDLGDEEDDEEEEDDEPFESKPLPTIVQTGDIGLQPSDKQVIAIAKRYYLLREGGWWRQLLDDLANAGVVPVEADAALVEAYLERSFDAAAVVQLEQMALLAADFSAKASVEQEFVAGIRLKQQQAIKAAWLKKYGKAKKML